MSRDGIIKTIMCDNPRIPQLESEIAQNDVAQRAQVKHATAELQMANRVSIFLNSHITTFKRWKEFSDQYRKDPSAITQCDDYRTQAKLMLTDLIETTEKLLLELEGAVQSGQANLRPFISIVRRHLSALQSAKHRNSF